MNLHKVKLELEMMSVGTRQVTRGRVFIDGIEIKNLRAVEIKSSFDMVTEVTLTFFADVEAEIDAAIQVNTDDSR